MFMEVFLHEFERVYAHVCVGCVRLHPYTPRVFIGARTSFPLSLTSLTYILVSQYLPNHHILIYSFKFFQLNQFDV